MHFKKTATTMRIANATKDYFKELDYRQGHVHIKMYGF